MNDPNAAFKAWRDAGAYVYTTDGRCIPLKQLWEEIYDKSATDWARVFAQEPPQS